MSKRSSLTISEKLDIIKYADSNRLSLRALARIFSVGKSHIGEILKHRTEIEEAAKSGAKLKTRIGSRRLRKHYGGDEQGEIERRCYFCHYSVGRIARGGFIDFCDSAR